MTSIVKIIISKAGAANSRSKLIKRSSTKTVASQGTSGSLGRASSLADEKPSETITNTTTSAELDDNISDGDSPTSSFLESVSLPRSHLPVSPFPPSLLSPLSLSLSLTQSLFVSLSLSPPLSHPLTISLLSPPPFSLSLLPSLPPPSPPFSLSLSPSSLSLSLTHSFPHYNLIFPPHSSLHVLILLPMRQWNHTTHSMKYHRTL